MKENKLIAEFMDFPTQRDAVDNGTIAYYVGESIMHTNNTNNMIMMIMLPIFCTNEYEI